MGSLIALHTAVESPAKPDGLILVSPVVSLDAIPNWQVSTLRLAASIAPNARVSLESLAGGSFQATTHSNHFDRSEKNPYHVDSYTLRYLSTLAKLSQAMTKNASQTSLPTLILHGGKDFLTQDYQIQKFADAFPQRPQVSQFEKSHHLLFYDKDKEEVTATVRNWVARPLLF